MSISAENLREGQQILVRGKVAFSRLTALITGDELAKSIDRARKRGSKYPTLKPHTTISLLDPMVLFADSNAPTPEEQYVSERFYVGKSGANAGRRAYSIDSTSPFLPTVLEQDPSAPGAYRQLVLERDLDTDMDVTLVLQMFKPKDSEKRAIGLQQVILNEAVRYYNGGGGTDALAARGIVVNGPISAVSAAPADAPAAAPVAQQPGMVAPAVPTQDPWGAPQVPANTHITPDGLAAPMPGAQGTPFAQPQAPAQVAPAQPVAPAAPVQQQAPAAPMAETPEQTIARLQQQLQEQQNAAAASGGASAFDGATAAPNPWEVGQSAPVFQG